MDLNPHDAKLLPELLKIWREEENKSKWFKKDIQEIKELRNSISYKDFEREYMQSPVSVEKDTWVNVDTSTSPETEKRWIDGKITR